MDCLQEEYTQWRIGGTVTELDSRGVTRGGREQTVFFPSNLLFTASLTESFTGITFFYFDLKLNNIALNKKFIS